MLLQLFHTTNLTYQIDELLNDLRILFSVTAQLAGRLSLIRILLIVVSLIQW